MMKEDWDCAIDGDIRVFWNAIAQWSSDSDTLALMLFIRMFR